MVGRLVLVKSVLTSIPVYHSIAMQLPVWLIDGFEKRIRVFFWKATDVVSGGYCLVAWEQVCKPFEYGGLGVLNLKLLGYAVRARWLWRQRRSDCCWSGLQPSMEPEVQAIFDSSIKVTLGDGRKALFWTDFWLHGRSIQFEAPELFLAVNDGARRTRTVHEALADRAWIRDITGVLTVRVLLQFMMLTDLLLEVHLLLEIPDRIIWKWTQTEVYSASSAYQVFFAGLERFPCGRALWKTWAPAKCKLHFWLAMRRRIWTADRRLRHGLQSHVMCPLCEQEAETADHLALGCVFAREVWHSALWRYGLGQLVPAMDATLTEWWAANRAMIPKERRKGFDSLALLIVWLLWRERNSRVFERSAVVARELYRRISDEVELWKLSGARGLSDFWR